VVVSNEVGLGIVPANALARTYRDVLGRVNASFAAQASRSLFVVAGRGLPLEEVTPT
jgi:adenosyl cobinamide kinase/adenosyl cobinamide phosphate guanylyltransferase